MYELLEKYIILEEMFEHGNIDEETLRDTLESIEGDIYTKVQEIITIFQKKLRKLKNFLDKLFYKVYHKNSSRS